jgi:ATP-dependent DNA ligase
MRSESKVEGETGAVTWLEPRLVCTIEYMPNTKGSLRQPVFKGIRDDIDPLTVQVKS